MNSGARRTRAWHHHESVMPTCPMAILMHSSLLGGYKIIRHTVYPNLTKEEPSLKVFLFFCHVSA